MAYVNVPKDLSKVKTKVMFNLTKRQLICFGSGALVGVPLFFLLKSYISTSTASLCMVLVMLPFFLFAMYEKNGQPFEKDHSQLCAGAVCPFQAQALSDRQFLCRVRPAVSFGQGGTTHCLQKRHQKES